MRLWYARQSRAVRAAIIGGGVALALVAVVLVAWMLMNPGKVQVTYGKIVKDPRCGYVFEDDTQTIWVKPSEAANYKLEVEERYCDKCKEEIQAEVAKRIEEEKKLEESSGLEAMTMAIPEEQMQDLETLQSNIKTMQYQVVQGIEMANQIVDTKNDLVEFRNTIINTQLPPELSTLEGKKQELVAILDLYIAACDLGIKAIDTADTSYAAQAQELLNEANARAQALITEYQQLFQ